MSRADDLPETEGYERWQVYLSAVVGLVVAFVLVWVASGFSVFYETLFRVGPTPSEGVGAEWAAGNTVPWLDALVAITHAVDVLMGLFILVMVFLHWAAFHRLASRMRGGGEQRGAVAADGGTETEGGESR